MKNKSGRKISIIVVLAVISLISILAINAVESAVENKKLTEQRDNISESVNVYNEQIAEAEKKNDSSDEKQLEDQAREDGYIYPDEIVYADSAN